MRSKSFAERIADVLIEDGLLLPSQLEEAVGLQQKEGGRLLKILTDKQFVTDQDMTVSMGRCLNTPLINLSKLRVPEDVMSLVPRELAKTNKLVPIARLNGKLFVAMADPTNLLAITSRIKILAGLNIAERRIPQDGRFRIKVLAKDVDLRVSILPTAYGEKIVIRILDKAALTGSIDQMGMDQSTLDKFKKAIDAPHGMILVTGPTGSGKTTTLYSVLQELNNPQDNILTVEGPIEYELTGINQGSVRNGIGLDFASALRSILRQDPDIVMVGEIRDNETADIAVKAALTGHQVLSTLH